uniref:DNA polymerase epsilon subunit 3 n=1 Tax=Ornithorhynchus anatinus TaxID=9258 RepID=A0A6I8NBY2_ORNAN
MGRLRDLPTVIQQASGRVGISTRSPDTHRSIPCFLNGPTLRLSPLPPPKTHLFWAPFPPLHSQGQVGTSLPKRVPSCHPPQLPDGVNISKEARSAISRAASVFVLYATSCANNFAMKGKRKTLNAGDVLSAMEEMEFQRFMSPLKEALEAYRREQKGKKEASEQKKKDKDKKLDSEEQDKNREEDNDEDDERMEEEEQNDDDEVDN